MQAVIDLGEDWAPPADSERPLRQISPRVPLALLSLVLVALLGGSALPRYTMVSLFSVPLATNGAYAIGSDAVYTERDGEITGYRLPGGARRWSAEVGHPVDALQPIPEAGVVLAEYGTGEDGWGGVVALDARTGRVRWRDDRARVESSSDPHHLLLSTPGEMPADSGWMGAPGEVRVVDTATGHTIWSRRPTLGSVWAASGAPAEPGAPLWAVFDTGDGETEVLDAATGAVAGRAKLSPPTGIMSGETGNASNGSDASGGIVFGSDGQMMRVEVDPATGAVVSSGAVVSIVANRGIIGDRLFSVFWDGAGSLLDAYDLPTLAHEWGVRLPIRAYTVTDCGTLLCAYSFNSMAGIDPRTGSVKWNNQMLRGVYPLPGGRLLAESANDALPSAVLDASSLRPLLTLTRWEHVGGIGDRILMARDDASVLRTWFGELDPAGPSLRVFGSATGVLADQCVHSDTYLVCPTTKNQLRLWRLHPLP